MEQYKAYCAQHPYEAITNFDTQELIGLCASCIGEHTAASLRKGVTPKYQNVKETYQIYNQRMRAQIEKIEGDKEWLSKICDSIDEKKKVVKGTLIQARQECLELVHRHFDELEAKIDSEIANQSKKNSLHSYHRLETLDTLMNKELSSLLIYANELSSPKFLESIKKVETDIFPSSEDFHLRITKELKENQVYTASAVYRSEYLGDLSQQLKKLVNLEFLLPQVQYVVDTRQPPRAPSRDSVRQRPPSLQRNNSSVILNGPRVSNLSIKPIISSLNPRNTTSVIVTTVPQSPVLRSIPRNSSQLTSSMMRSSHLSPELNSIRETKREISQADSSSELASSSTLLGKENDLAQSTYYESCTNFFRK